MVPVVDNDDDDDECQFSLRICIESSMVKTEFHLTHIPVQTLLPTIITGLFCTIRLEQIFYYLQLYTFSFQVFWVSVTLLL